ncbi:MAG: TerB family tellurite resistance protein [Gammaproteobacteria bacterium]|nr:TerB family tellurite resistance protein [Gammaproteobacteria bacterium]
MHVILGLLGTIVTILYLLHRLAEMGIDLAGLNPFYWRRRRAWQKQYEGDPIYAVEDPTELAAIVIAAVAKIEGDITAEQKRMLLSEFANRFSLSDREASHLLGSTTHLLGQPQIIENQLDGLFERHKDVFSAEQAESLATMMQKVAAAEGTPSAAQIALMASVRDRLGMAPSGDGVWN